MILRELESELVEMLGGDVESRTAQRLRDLVGGTPLFLRELVREGYDSGQLTRHAGPWRWDGPMEPPQRVRLVELTHENIRDYGRLRTHRTQERFVATVEQSYADALFPEPQDGHPVLPVLRGVEADGEPAGFLMYAAAGEGTPHPFLWRFLVDRRHQGRRVGERALSLWLDDLRAAGHAEVRTSWVQAPGGPEPFYLRAGFALTGETDDGEVVARLRL